MFLSWLLLASSAALFLTVGSQGPCVPANCSAAMSDLPPLCNCDENCTEFAEDCCGPQHLESTIRGRCVVEGQVNRSLVCVNGSLSDTVPACPDDMVRILFSEITTLAHILRTVELVYDYCGRVLVVCIPQLIPIPPGIVAISSVSYSLSILGSVFILLTHSLFKELRTLPGILLMNLSVTIIMLNIFRIAPLVLRRVEPNSERVVWVVCISIQVYFIYTESMWMSFLLLQMARSLYLAWKLSRPSMFSPVCLVPIGWGLPIVLCTLLLGIHSVIDISFLLFYLPLYFAMVVNFSLLIAATVFLCLFSRNRRRIKHSYHHDLIRLWIAFLAVTFPALTALFDVFYIAATTTPRGLTFLLSNLWAVYGINVLSGSQVFAITLAFLCTKKTLKLYRDLFTCTLQNTKAGAKPIATVGSPDAGGGQSSDRVQVGERLTRGGTLTREGETPIGDGGETATGEGNAPTGEGDTPTGEGETPTGEGEAPIGEGATPTGEGEAPTGEEETPTGEGDTPTGEGDIPTGEGETPTGEGETPTGEGETPTGEGDTPTGEGDTPTGEGETPTGEGDTPTGEGDTPTGEGETPTGEGDTPTGERDPYRREASAGAGETPEEDSIGGTYQRERGSIWGGWEKVT